MLPFKVKLIVFFLITKKKKPLLIVNIWNNTEKQNFKGKNHPSFYPQGQTHFGAFFQVSSGSQVSACILPYLLFFFLCLLLLLPAPRLCPFLSPLSVLDPSRSGAAVGRQLGPQTEAQRTAGCGAQRDSGDRARREADGSGAPGRGGLPAPSPIFSLSFYRFQPPRPLPVPQPDSLSPATCSVPLWGLGLGLSRR